MATFLQLQTAVAEKIGIDMDDSVELTLLKQWLNQGVRDVLLRTKCRVTTAQLALTAGSGDYDLDTDVLALNELYLSSGGSDSPLERVTPADILMYRRASSVAGALRYYAVDGANLLMVYPTPGAADTLVFYYVPVPSEMTADANDPAAATYGGIPVEHHKLIEKYALMEAADYDDDISSQVGRKYLEEYEREIKLARHQMLSKGGRRKLGRIVVNRGRRSQVPANPSQDY